MKLELKSLSQNGFVKFSATSTNVSTLDLARTIGHINSISENASVQTLIPLLVESADQSSYSGNFGMGEFPLHTDMAHWHVPPRFFLLRCIQPAEEVHTSFVSADELFESEDHITLKRALFRPRRRLDSRLTILRLYDRGAYRWDTLFIQPMNSSAFALQARVTKRLGSVSVRNVTLENPKDCILVDNWKVLHGRSAVPRSAANRIVERAYLSSVRGLSHAEG